MEPIYFTVDTATDPTPSPAGISTITFNEFIPYELFPDDPFALQRISRIPTENSLLNFYHQSEILVLVSIIPLEF